jgi:hypothetical protein
MTDGHESPPEELDQFIDDVRARQRNFVFPDTVRNGRAVYVLLWRGSPDPGFVQRIGAWLFGLVCIASGVTFLPSAAQSRGDEDWAVFGFALVASLGWISLGIKLFRNGFPRHQGPNSN